MAMVGPQGVGMSLVPESPFGRGALGERLSPITEAPDKTTLACEGKGVGDEEDAEEAATKDRGVRAVVPAVKEKPVICSVPGMATFIQHGSEQHPSYKLFLFLHQTPTMTATGEHQSEPLVTLI